MVTWVQTWSSASSTGNWIALKPRPGRRWQFLLMQRHTMRGHVSSSFTSSPSSFSLFSSAYYPQAKEKREKNDKCIIIQIRWELNPLFDVSGGVSLQRHHPNGMVQFICTMHAKKKKKRKSPSLLLLFPCRKLKEKGIKLWPSSNIFAGWCQWRHQRKNKLIQSTIFYYYYYLSTDCLLHTTHHSILIYFFSFSK